jgi:hypothetical protein
LDLLRDDFYIAMDLFEVLVSRAPLLATLCESIQRLQALAIRSGMPKRQHPRSDRDLQANLTASVDGDTLLVANTLDHPPLHDPPFDAYCLRDLDAQFTQELSSLFDAQDDLMASGLCPNLSLDCFNGLGTDA